MDKNILKGRYPDLYGFLILVDHEIPAGEIWDQLRFRSEQYMNSGENRTQKFHELFDRTMEKELEADSRDGFRPPVCAKGCINCCYQPVACTVEEARLIYSYCIENNITIDFEKLERQLNFITADADGNFTGETTWNDQPEEDQACAFLDRTDGSCTVWAVRPFVCRNSLAEKTNAFCKPHNGVPDPRAIGIQYPSLSYILSSVFSVHHDSVGKMMNRLLLCFRR